MNYIERFSQLFSELDEEFIIYNNSLWVTYKRMVQPFGPVKLDYSLSLKEAKRVLNQGNGLLIRWTNGFQNNKCKEWYAMICDTFRELEDLSPNTRSKIRRGLKRNEVKLIDAAYLNKYAYDVYTKAFKKYRGKSQVKPQLSREEFKRLTHKYGKYDDIVHVWGVFNNKGEIVAFTINYIFEKIESFSYLVIFDPDYLKDYISYALYFKMKEYYLKEKKFEYINEGYRNILHETEIHDFLQKKFFFKKAFMNLHLVYKPHIKLILKSFEPFKFISEKIDPRLAALYLQDSISKRCLGPAQK